MEQTSLSFKTRQYSQAARVQLVAAVSFPATVVLGGLVTYLVNSLWAAWGWLALSAAHVVVYLACEAWKTYLFGREALRWAPTGHTGAEAASVADEAEVG